MLYKNSSDQSVQLFRPGFIEIALFPPKGKKVKILLAFQKSARFSLKSTKREVMSPWFLPSVESLVKVSCFLI
jgi:hypothetical protein